MSIRIFKATWAEVSYPVRVTTPMCRDADGRLQKGGEYVETHYAHGCFGLLVNPLALWVGAHWSGHNRRLCVNLIPCVTIWITMPGGAVP